MNVLFRARLAQNDGAFGDRKVAEDELSHQITDHIELRVVVAVTQPLEEDAIAGLVEGVVDRMSLLDILQLLPERVWPMMQDIITSRACSRPFRWRYRFPARLRAQG